MIEILDSGYHITVQDSGRFGLSKYGVPSAGSMDYVSACNANSLVGNSNNEAVFETDSASYLVINFKNQIVERAR